MSAREPKGRGSSRPEGHPRDAKARDSKACDSKARDSKARGAVRTEGLDIGARGRHRLAVTPEWAGTAEHESGYEGRHRVPDGLEANGAKVTATAPQGPRGGHPASQRGAVKASLRAPERRGKESPVKVERGGGRGHPGERGNAATHEAGG